MQFRLYLDTVEEVLSYYTDIDDPCEYVKYTPNLFNRWSKWARTHKPEQQDSLRPFGQKLGPDWMKTDFDGLETFYQFYIDLLLQED